MCTAHTSARRLVSKSSWLRMSALAAWRFWLTMTNVDRKIASKLTIMVRRPKGNLSKTSAPPMAPTFSSTHTPNHAECR